MEIGVAQRGWFINIFKLRNNIIWSTKYYCSIKPYERTGNVCRELNLIKRIHED